MTIQQDQEVHKICSKLLDEGKYNQALLLAETIYTPSLKASILIDAGTALRRSGKVREGTEIYESILQSDAAKQGYARHSLLYNAANGRSSLYELKRSRRNSIVPPNDEDLRTAKRYYREAYKELNAVDGAWASRILVNTGNCMASFGRFAEAIGYYEKALTADPENGMAAGNLALELEYAAFMTGRYRHEYMAVVHELLTRVFGPDMHLRYGSKPAVERFQAAYANVAHFLNSHPDPIPPPTPVSERVDASSDPDYSHFCVDKGLLLNPWIGNQNLSPDLIDNVAFGPIVTPIGEDVVPELLNILDEIKESFSTARYLYYLSQREQERLTGVSGMTFYHGVGQFSIRGIYTGLCKAAYARAFDVLDKVARIINVYFGIGKREFSFWKLLATKQSRGEEHNIRFVVPQKICEMHNFGLYALADLCIDYFESEHVDLKTIDRRRNRITHDFLDVRLYLPQGQLGGDSGKIALDDLNGETGRVLLLAKYAVLYVLSAVQISEMQKQPIDDGKIYTREYLDRAGEAFL